jgi:hypothetical protein
MRPSFDGEQDNHAQSIVHKRVEVKVSGGAMLHTSRWKSLTGCGAKPVPALVAISTEIETAPTCSPKGSWQVQF